MVFKKGAGADKDPNINVKATPGSFKTGYDPRRWNTKRSEYRKQLAEVLADDVGAAASVIRMGLVGKDEEGNAIVFRDRLSAANTIFDRVFGKSVTPVVDARDKTKGQVIEMDADELTDFIEGQYRALEYADVQDEGA